MTMTGFLDAKIVVQLSTIHYLLSTQEIGNEFLAYFSSVDRGYFAVKSLESHAVAQFTVDTRVEELDVFERVGIAAV